MDVQDRATGIVIHNENILLIERKKPNQHYWVFPGGGVEEGESIEEAVVREIVEETSIKVTIEKKLYTHFYDQAHKNRGNQHFYLCRYESGEPLLGESGEKKAMESGLEYYKPLWYPTSDLEKLLLYPLEIRDWLMEDLRNDFKYTPRTEKIKVEDLRNEL